MGKSGKWFRIFSSGKKDKKEKCVNSSSTPSTPLSIPSSKDKKRWSFRRSSATAPTSKDLNSATAPTSKEPEPTILDSEKKHAMEIAAAMAAATEAALAAAEAAAVVIQLTNRATAMEEAAATKIQAAFRSHLARKALCALRGLVKLQALVRGHLVRKQATATLRCMQALITAQARARAQRIQSVEHEIHRKDQLMQPYNDLDRGLEENIKIVEMDSGDSKGGYKNRHSYSNRTPNGRYSKHEHHHYQVPPSPTALTDMSPRTFSGRFEDYCYSTAQSSPQPYSKLDSAGLPFAFPPPEYAESLSYDYSLYPNYMANTQSSRAKARSQSAPKQRPAEPFERQPSRRRISVEGRNVPRAVRMQRSSSHVGATAHNYQYPWSIKLDRSTVSLIESECGSTSTVLTNNYCRSVAAYDPQENRY